MATATATTTSSSKTIRLIGILLLVAGGVMIAAGTVTWFTVRSQLVAEDITIPDDAAAFQGNKVNGPIDAFVQADIIKHHALEATKGKTYAQLDREDPLRDVVATGSFLRTSLFSSVIAFGVVYNSARISLSERSRELATLRVIGFTRAEISYILLGEIVRKVSGQPLDQFAKAQIFEPLGSSEPLP